MLCQTRQCAKDKERGLIGIIIILVIAGVIAAGFYIYSRSQIPETSEETTTASGPLDCSTNMDCLISASQNCQPAKITYEYTVDMFGMLIKTTTFYEIKGAEANKCVLYLKTVKQDIEFSEKLIQEMLVGGATQEQIEQQKQESNKLADLVEGKDGVCRFNNNSDLVSLLGKIKEGDFSGSVSCSLEKSGESKCTSAGDWAVADCEGEMFMTQVSQ